PTASRLHPRTSEAANYLWGIQIKPLLPWRRCRRFLLIPRHRLVKPTASQKAGHCVTHTFKHARGTRKVGQAHLPSASPSLLALGRSRSRWGVTDELKAEGKVLRICLEEIRRFHILWAFWVTVMGGSSIRSQLVKGAIICSSSFHHPFTHFVPQCKHAGSNG